MDVSLTTVMIGLPVAAGSGVALQVATDFLKRVFGPPGDELGKAIAHPIREWNEARVRRGLETLEAAATILSVESRSATPVPGRVLFPVLQAASVEEDSELRRKWAMLLANAADANRTAEMMPSFVSILSELSPVEAHLLELVYRDREDSPTISYSLPGPKPVDFSLVEVFAQNEQGEMVPLELPFGNFRVLLDNLGRLGLIEQTFAGPTGYGASLSNKVYSAPLLTDLGRQFVAACTELNQGTGTATSISG